MQSNEEDKLVDIMLGEAVLKLLHGGGAISLAALTTTLLDMSRMEEDSARKHACLRAVHDVRKSTSANHARGAVRGAQDGSNVLQMFADDPTAEKDKH